MEGTLNAIVDFWRQSAHSNFEAAEILFANKKYDSCLFFCHLAIEKIMKGLVVARTERAAPYIHDLVELANLASVTVSDKRRKVFATISTFNIAGRYDSEKLQFYKMCTREYAHRYLQESKAIFLWLEKQYQKK